MLEFDIIFCVVIPQGLVQLEVLRKIEDLTGKRITELFDWIVGTSTGGIVTLGSVYGELG